jgi:acetoacetyl-CoA synthetase
VSERASGEILWRPTPDLAAASRMAAFREDVCRRRGLDLPDYDALWRWSVESREDFWADVWDFCGVRGSRRWDRVLSDGDRMPGARWFEGARLNLAENLLRRRDDAEAIVFRGEAGGARRITFAELYGLAARAARALRDAGVRKGDRVAGFMPNIPETVVAMLGAASLGAVWSSCSPDFGVQGTLDRFGQIEPVVLFAADGYVYSGKRCDSLERVRGLLDRLPTVRKAVIVPYLSEKPDLTGLRDAVTFNEFLGTGDAGEIPFEPLPFDHPLYILYSSGTTGLPKCIVHSAGGTLLQHLKEHVLHCDIRRDDRVFYYTTCGWMMWNWLASVLATEATIMLFDGNPFTPETVLWDYAAAERFTCLGTSAKYLAAAEKAGLAPRRTHDLSHLTSILSTGSPLLPESFDWVYREVKADVRLSSIAGGTDIVSCFVLGSPTLPVRRGEIQCRGLGMAVDVFDDSGIPVAERKGELVCTRAFPSMPLGFWNDQDGSRYHAAYFDVYPNVWRHGDFVELRESGGIVMLGRSDALLNPGGVRIGTSEIYRVVDNLPEVMESVAIGQSWQGDVRIVLFVRLRPGNVLDDALKAKIRAALRREETPRHVPSKIIEVAAIPRTLSGKLTELAVSDVVHGRPVKNREALANPEALDLFKGIPELGTE